jgi:hypothetical protein
MTLQDQIDLYLKVSRCWNNHRLEGEPILTFGVTCKVLRAIIDRPASPLIGKRAQILLDDIAKNNCDPKPIATTAK